jgi:UDP-N-acetylmuramate dehydrogenase
MRFDEERRGILCDLKNLGVDSKILRFSDITTVGIGGEPYCFVFPKTLQDIQKVLEYIHKNQIPFWVVGNGSKLLVRDGKIPRVVVSLHRFEFCKEWEDENYFYVSLGSGVSLQFLVALGIKRGFEGVEKISGIPGCIGGAIKMNAGTRLGSISEFVQNVEVITMSNGEINIEKIKPDFGYRCSSIQNNQIILSASFRFGKAKPGDVRDKVSKYLKKRFETQPVNSKTFGCIFKNPDNGESAGKIIEEVGLKGFKMTKRVKISSLHANFIENEGGACFQEADDLINYVKEKVKEKKKLTLQEEVVKFVD